MVRQPPQGVYPQPVHPVRAGGLVEYLAEVISEIWCKARRLWCYGDKVRVRDETLIGLRGPDSDLDPPGALILPPSAGAWRGSWRGSWPWRMVPPLPPPWELCWLPVLLQLSWTASDY
jgi:hypothetical protein